MLISRPRTQSHTCLSVSDSSATRNRLFSHSEEHDNDDSSNNNNNNKESGKVTAVQWSKLFFPGRFESIKSLLLTCKYGDQRINTALFSDAS